MKNIIFTILLSSLCISMFGQSNMHTLTNLIDSLKNELKIEEIDTLKAEILLQLSENVLYSDPDSAIYYGEKCLELAERTNNIHYQLGALGFIGNAIMNKGDLPKALEFGFRAIDMAKNVPVRIAGIGPTYDNMGQIYFKIGDYEKALYYFKKMVDMGEFDRVGVAFGYWHLAEVYEKQNMLDSAMLCLDESFQAFSTLNHSFFPNVYHVAPGWYNLRAKIYLRQQKPDLALNDLFTALQMTLKIDQSYYSSITYNDISAYYRQINKQDSSIYYAEKGLAEAKRISNTEGILSASEILAEQYESVDPNKALYYFKLAVENRNKLYGAGNIQIMRDMITQYEEKQREIITARLESRNRIRINALIGSLFTLVVIALLLIRNSRMKNKAKRKIESAFDQLKATQSQLIQSEKMASLGELTAGIAHEIQNPLNFVNNFSEVSEELLNELGEELDKGELEEAKEISADVIENLKKIYHHGQRASGIVKGMLEHSRTGDGKKEPTDINTLADEYLRLAYHGLRAKDKSFNVDFNLDIDKKLPKINVIPQDVGRVLLNLINNAFYAVSKKTKEGIAGYSPKVLLSTKTIKSTSGSVSVEIRIKDNGNGIPKNILDKIFQPFFTTKPAGEGTGLGLSLSYDIITKGHGGELKVETNEIEGSEFTIIIPE